MPFQRLTDQSQPLGGDNEIIIHKADRLIALGRQLVNLLDHVLRRAETNGRLLAIMLFLILNLTSERERAGHAIDAMERATP